ncbi:MAG TPA: periplasmic heavy metal sensor [Alphaproteobacteria bacterium]|nr:periplasmic heavy metal sensor [Alphaproteobacteria bacterium]
MAGVVGVSMALNALLLVQFVGFHAKRDLSFQQRFENQLDAIWRALPETDQAIARDIIAERHDELLRKWRTLLSDSGQAAVALRASSFDEGAARRAFGQLNQAFSEYQTAFQSVKVDIASSVSDEGRRHLSLWRPDARHRR